MNTRVWTGLFCACLLVACSEGDTEPAPEAAEEMPREVSYQTAGEENFIQEEADDPGCGGLESIIALLPDRLNGERTSEQYFSCDSVAPKAASHFVSEDEGTFWTFSVTSRQLDTPLARRFWDLNDIDESQREYLRKGVKAAIDGEVLLLDLCTNSLEQTGLPEWHKTSQASTESHEICVGSDAQMVEDGRWVARAQSPDYLYTVEIEGERALEFGSAQEAASYAETLFRNFRSR